MQCPACEHENRPERKFCAACGAALAVNCPECRTRNAAGERFCGECGSTLAAPAARTPAAHAPAPEAFANGRYAVRRLIGEGGKKRVYLAHDTQLDRDVAVAVVKTDGLDAEALLRVRREAQAMALLGDHPHVVTVQERKSVV